MKTTLRILCPTCDYFVSFDMRDGAFYLGEVVHEQEPHRLAEHFLELEQFDPSELMPGLVVERMHQRVAGYDV